MISLLMRFNSSIDELNLIIDELIIDELIC